MQTTIIGDIFTKTSKVPLTHIPLEMYLDGLCRHCLSSDTVKKGSRDHKYTKKVQIYLCKKCGKKFTFDPSCSFRYPLLVIDKILDLHVQGVNAENIRRIIIKDAKHREENIYLTKQTVINIIKKASILLSSFEEHLFHPIEANEWQIDDAYQRIPYYHHGYVTNVLAVEQRYWLSSFVTNNRDTDASLRALYLAAKRAGYQPKIVKSDGHQPHITAAEFLLHGSRIMVRSKKESIGWINYVERLHRTMRDSQLKKNYRFHSLELLQASAELTRISYNFLKTHVSLKRKTPAFAVGITIPFHDWRDLIRYADFLSWYTK